MSKSQRTQKIEKYTEEKAKSLWKKIGLAEKEKTQIQEEINDQENNKTSLELQVRVIEDTHKNKDLRGIMRGPNFKHQSSTTTKKTKKKNFEDPPSDNFPIKKISQSIYIVSDINQNKNEQNTRKKNLVDRMKMMLMDLMDQVRMLRQELNREKEKNIREMKKAFEMIEQEMEELKDRQLIVKYSENEEFKTKIKQQQEENKKLKDIIFTVNRQFNNYIMSSKAYAFTERENNIQHNYKPNLQNNNLQMIKIQLSTINQGKQKNVKDKMNKGNYSQNSHIKDKYQDFSQGGSPLNRNKRMRNIKALSFNVELQKMENVQAFRNMNDRSGRETMVSPRNTSPRKPKTQRPPIGEIEAIKKKIQKLKSTIQGIQ